MHSVPAAALLALLVVNPALADAPAPRLDGEIVQGGLVVGRASPDARVEIDGEPVPQASDGTFLIGIARDRERPLQLAVDYGERGVHRAQLAPRKRSFDVQRIDGLPREKVTPDPAALERIRAEAARVRRARERRDDRTDFSGGFDWPVTGPITGVYGSQRILNGEPRSPHWGIDIAAPAGTPVRAPAPGVVTLVHADMYFSGGTLLLDHGLGLSSAFLHLEDILVDEGERVERGETIATVGATGRATGAHLDWRMNLGPVRVDPALLVGEMPDEGAGAPR
jgi:murein DD-endopeptidase MepM/ murein hydrolase activator NlpD